MPSHGPADPADDSGPAPATQAECIAKLTRDFAGLEEICRWQWNLVQRIKQHLELLSSRERE
jgi:hypothetical protein